MRKEYEEKTNKGLNPRNGNSLDSINMIIKQLRRNNRLWIVMRLKEYGKRWDAIHKMRRFQ